MSKVHLTKVIPFKSNVYVFLLLIFLWESTKTMTAIDSQLQKKGWKIVAKCDKSVLYYNQNKSENNVYITVSTSTPVHQVGNLIKKFKLMSWMLSLAKAKNCPCGRSALKKGNFISQRITNICRELRQT